MNLYVAICLLAVAASASADGALGLVGLGGLGGPVYAPGHASADYYAYPRYAFEYSVKDPHTGDNKAQWEKRDGDVVKGAYSLVEPDGSLRVVEYWADDKSGFNAVVKRLGPNLHPATVHAAPIYKAPIPVLGHGPVVSPISVGPVANLGHLASAPLISGPIAGPIVGPIHGHGPALSTQNLIQESVPIVKNILPVPIVKPILPAPILTAPVHTIPYHGPAVSTQTLLREPVPIVKSLPVPILREPIVHRPILQEPRLHRPVLQEPYILQQPILPGPIYKSGPIYSKPLGPLPIYKAPLPVYNEARPLPILKGPIELGPVGDWQVIGKGPIGPWEGLGKGPLGWDGLVKGPIGPIGGHIGGPIVGPIDGHIGGPIESLPYNILEKGLLPAWNGPLEYPLYPGGYKH